LKEAVTFGISHSTDGKLSYFRIEKTLTAAERIGLVGALSSGRAPDGLYMLGVEEFIQQIEGRRAKHIWLEMKGERRGERAFASLSELKNFLQTDLRHQ